MLLVAKLDVRWPPAGCPLAIRLQRGEWSTMMRLTALSDHLKTGGVGCPTFSGQGNCG